MADQASHKKHHEDYILSRFEPVIGLEVHCQLQTRSKLFCGCTTEFGGLPNQHTCPVCLALPGALPVLNRQAVDFAIQLALAVEGTIHETSIFARKQYFYPDLPKGYQISQYDKPYCTDGRINLASGRQIRIMRIHMEEDAGKNVHAGKSSYVDLNRAGVPLLEIVSHPDLQTAEEASEYLRRLRSLVRHLGISDGNLEEGSFRCDVNLSLRRVGTTPLGTRCEIKNINSFKNVERAIHYEIVRQADLLEAGQKIVQSTLLFDASSGKTSVMRIKEDSQDYRYFPDPDLPPVTMDLDRIQRARQHLPELPEAMAERFVIAHGLSRADAMFIVTDRDLATFFEKTLACAGSGVTPKSVANWIMTVLMREVNSHEWDLGHMPLKPEALGELLALIGEGTISGRMAKGVFDEMITTGNMPRAIVNAKGLVQVSDRDAIEKVVSGVLAAAPAQVEEYLSGKEKVFGFFVGQIMKASQGTLNPAMVSEILKELLSRK